MDPVLLLIGLLRCLVFAYGVVWAARRHRLIATVGFGLAAANSVIFAFLGAGAHLEMWVRSVGTFAAGPVAVLLVAAVLMGRMHPRPGEKWSL